MSNKLPPSKWLAFWLVCLLLCLAGMRVFGLTPSERETVTQMKDTIVDLRGKLAGAETANDSALSSLTLATTQIFDLTAKAKVADAQVRQITADRDRAEKALAGEREAHTKTLAKYHSIKFYVGGTLAILAGALAGLLILRYGGLALNSVPGAAIAFGVPFGVAVATFSFIWFRL
jgi:hypothetical protein